MYHAPVADAVCGRRDLDGAADQCEEEEPSDDERSHDDDDGELSAEAHGRCEFGLVIMHDRHLWTWDYVIPRLVNWGLPSEFPRPFLVLQILSPK